MQVMVTGASGTLGTAVLPRLAEDGHRVRGISRRARSGNGVEWAVADLATGGGLKEAVAGADAIIHLATSPYRPGGRNKVDIDGTRRLAEAARDAGVRQLLYVSIVGIDRVPFAYYRTKLAAERILQGAGVGWTILRATQFHQLVDMALTALNRPPVLVIDPALRAQPVDPRDVADRIAGLISIDPVGATVEFGGPEALTADEAVRAWQELRGSDKKVIRASLPGNLGTAVRAGGLTTDAEPTGSRTWRAYLQGT